MPAQVSNAGVQYMSVHVSHAALWPLAHCDAQCCAPQETTVPQQAAQPVVRVSIVLRHVATHVARPAQSEEMYWPMQLLSTHPDASFPTLVMSAILSAASVHAPGVPPLELELEAAVVPVVLLAEVVVPEEVVGPEEAVVVAVPPAPVPLAVVLPLAVEDAPVVGWPPLADEVLPLLLLPHALSMARGSTKTTRATLRCAMRWDQPCES
jgi:hypothetical protein